MSARDRERESEIEKLDDLAALRKLRSSRKGQITKIEHDFSKYVIESAKRGTSSKKWFREKAYLKN